MKLSAYYRLLRLDKPVGILLLLWPTLWALWLASSGTPNISLLMIFIAGVIVMRSAGCIINDIADRHLDKFVDRTKDRPITSGKVSVKEALLLLTVLLLIALWLVLQCNLFTIQLAGVGLLLTIIYPFLKRFTYLPQIGLGLAFAWGVPMAYAAQLNMVDYRGWVLYVAAIIWPIIYDTMYAMVDMDDDIKIGIKSSALYFHTYVIFVLVFLQIMFLILLYTIGKLYELHVIYFITLVLAEIFFIYQIYLIQTRQKTAYYKAFLNNQWVGLSIFAGIYGSYAFALQSWIS